MFTTNHGNIANDGNDVFSGVDFPNRANLFGKVGYGDITSDVSFGGANVNIVPEPGTVLLLGFGIGALVIARMRDRK